MKHLTQLVLPFLIALPTAAMAETPSETIEVVGTKPSSVRPGKPNLSLKLPEFSLNSQVFDFPTGLRIVMQSDRSHPIASVLMVVDHGAGDDPEGRNGNAHFVEHTWFRSVHGDLPPIMTLIQDLGTQFNATTRPDTTDFRTVASSEYLPLLMRLESLRLVEPYVGMTADQVDTEREVVRNEWRRRNEQSTSLAFDYLLKSVFPEGHPYHARETNESLDNITLESLQKYFDDYYHPETTTIIVVGDFDPAEASSLIFANFDPQLLHPKLKPEHLFKYPRPGIENPDRDNPDHWLTGAYDPEAKDEPFRFVDSSAVKPRVSPADATPLPAPPDQDDIQYYEAAVDNRNVFVGWALPGGFRGHDIDMTILANTASGAIMGYMQQAGLLDTQDKKKGLKDPGCFALPMKVNSVLACAVEVTDKKRWKDPQRVADLMMDQLAVIWNPEMVQMNQRYFGAGKMSELARVLRSVDDVAQHFGGRAEDIGFHVHQTGSVTYHSDRINEVMGIDFQTVADMGYEYLKRDRAAVVVVDPIPGSDVDTSAETSSYHGAAEGDAVVQSSDRLDAITADQIASSYVKPNLELLVDKRLANGMRVVILPHGESPLVEATLVFGGGLDSEPKGIYSFVGRFSENDWDQANDPLQIAAARTGQAGSNVWSSGVRAPAGNLDGALWFLREEVETTVPDLSYKTLYTSRRRDSFFGSLHSRGFHASDISQQHLYPEDPREWPTQYADIEAMEGWSTGTVRDYIARNMQPANTTLVIVGNVDADEALRQSVEYFAGWTPKPGVEVGPVELPKAGGMANTERVLIYDNEKRTQTQVTRECRLNFEGVEDVQAVAVLSNLVFDRTFSQLRVKEALAYSPGGSAFSSPDGSAVLAFNSLAVNTGVGRTVEFFRDLTAKLERGEADDKMLTLYKIRRARSLGVQAQSTSQMTGKLINTLAWAQPWSYLLDAGTTIANVDAAQIQRMVKGCNGRSITTLEGPASVITPQLDAKGIAYEIVDWKTRGNEMHEKIDPKGYKKHMKAEAKKKGKSEETDEDGSAEASDSPAE